MVHDVLDLRTNNWVPRREKVKGKKITEIHSEAEKSLGLRPGATTSIRNNRISGAQVITGPSGMPITRPGSGGMMHGIPGTRKIPGMRRSTPRGDGAGIQPMGRVHSASLNTRLLPQGTGGLMSGKSALLQGSGTPHGRPANFNSGSEPSFQSPASSKPAPAPYVPPFVEKPQAPAVRLNMDELGKKTVSLLEEYFSILDLGEALTCVEELKAPGYHPEFVKESISLALEKSPPRVDPLAKLLEHLLAKKVITPRDIETGCLNYGRLMDDIAIDLPKAPNNFGEIVGKLILVGGLDFKFVKEILTKMEDDKFQKTLFDATMNTVSESIWAKYWDSQASDIDSCRSCVLAVYISMNEYLVSNKLLPKAENSSEPFKEEASASGLQGLKKDEEEEMREKVKLRVKFPGKEWKQELIRLESLREAEARLKEMRRTEQAIPLNGDVLQVGALQFLQAKEGNFANWSHKLWTSF
ncbi:LOW QUALITY PROTEIN: eukaryotic translation initiation factor-like [Pistacia vera]|uniref:LOW QUALITY PROTEIN: eukaryotic translation initiation factor-like n=1 Tax=Pistacia vera TaxID=55513 RepID=UPI001263B8D5|nr:LOW QUALITY PROTEIN: eukaryotic translation initiation factor-like [Pistacia vera]